MKRIGVIDNLVNIDYFNKFNLYKANAEQIMSATGGNTGNIAFVFGVQKILMGKLGTVHWGDDPKLVSQHYDHLVICCANQLGVHTDLQVWADKLEQFNLPVTLIGLGVQSDNYNTYPDIPQGTMNFLDVVKKLSPNSSVNIAVRGDFTKKFLNEIGYQSVACGCPSLMISNQINLGERIWLTQNKEKVSPPKISVASGNPWHQKSAPLERVLIEIVERFYGDYVIQHPADMVKLSLNELESISDDRLSYFLNLFGFSDYSMMADWFKKNSVIFSSASDWMVHMRRSNLVLGPRYHGVALAVQAGVPGTVIAIDSRTMELSEQTGIKFLNLNNVINMSADDLIQACWWDKEDAQQFDNNRAHRAKQYKSFLESNNLNVSNHVLGLTTM